MRGPQCALCRKPIRKGASVTIVQWAIYGGMRQVDDGMTGFAIQGSALSVWTHTKCDETRRKARQEAAETGSIASAIKNPNAPS